MVEKELELPKPKPEPKKPTDNEKVLFVGDSDAGKKKNKEKSNKKKGDKKLLKEKDIERLKDKNASADDVLRDVNQQDLEFSKILNKPIANEYLKKLLAQSALDGDSLREAAIKLRDARVSGAIAAGEADFLLARMSNVIGEPILVEIAGGSGWTLYDSAAPGSASTTTVKDKLQEYQDVLENDPTLEENTRYLNQIAEDLAQSSLSPTEIRPYVAKIRDRIHRLDEQYVQSRERFSSMYATEKEEEGVIINPEWTIEQMLRRIDEFAEKAVFFQDSTSAEAAKGRLRLMGDYFSHDQYRLDIEAYITKNPSLSALEQARLRMHGETMYRKLSEKINYRTGIQNAFAVIHGLGDSEKIPNSLITVGVGGFEHLMNENGGLNEVVFHRYVDIYKQAKFDLGGDQKRITSTELLRIREKVNRAIVKDIDLYKDAYKSTGYKDELGNPKELTPQDCKAIVRQAEYLVTLSQQDLVAMLGGLGPAEGVGGISSFASTSTAEKYLSAMDINRWFFEKWTNLEPGQLVIWQNSCRLAVETDGREPLIKEKLRGVHKGDTRFKELVRETFGGAADGSQDESVLKRAKKALEVEKMKKTGNYYEIEYSNIDEIWDKMSIGFLHDQMVVAEGEKILGPLLEVYDHFSSVWRIDVHLDQEKAIFGDSTTGGYGDKLALGMRLRKAGAGYVGAETEQNKHEALDKLKDQLVITAEYRPQALFGFFVDGKDEQTAVWFNAHTGRIAGLFSDEETEFHHPINKQHELSSAISRRFIAINEKLTSSGLPPIKYADGLGALSPAQLSAVQEVCRITNIDINRYMNLMQEMSGFVRTPDMIDKLTTEKYNRIFYRTQWVDDVRFRQLEKTYEKDNKGDPVRYHDLACTVKNNNGEYVKSLVPGDIRHKAEEFTSISQVFTDRGQGNDDALVRSWRDNGLAVKTVQFVNDSLTPNAETYLKNITEIHKNVRIYSGATYATRAAAFLMGGWGETAKTDEIWDALFLNSLQNTSEMKRLFGSHAPSWGLNELEDFIHKHDYALLSKLELAAPHAYHTVAKYLGIENKGVIGNETRLPLYLYRSRMIIAIALILIAVESAKSAGAGLSEEKG